MVGPRTLKAELSRVAGHELALVSLPVQVLEQTIHPVPYVPQVPFVTPVLCFFSETILQCSQPEVRNIGS